MRRQLPSRSPATTNKNEISTNSCHRDDDFQIGPPEVSITILDDEKKFSPQEEVNLGEQSPAPGGEIAVVSETVRQVLADVDVKAAVATLKEGKFLLKYCQNSLRKVGIIY